MGTLLKILIAEDSPDDADLIIAQLRRAGFDPVWSRVETETDFLAQLETLPDIVLSDYSMPNFSGLRAAQLTRASGKNIPFILISGTVGEDAAVEAMKQGASDYLIKDRIARLGAAVERALEQKRLRNERQLTEEELRWKTTLLEAQLESSPDGILVVGPDGRRILQNRRMNEIWKIPPEAGVGTSEMTEVVFNPSQIKNAGPFLRNVEHLNAHPEAASSGVIELQTDSVLDWYSAPVRDKAGRNYGRIWCFRDITERRKLEAQFRQAQKMESIGMLAGGIAHDFNNILSAILGNLYLVQMETENKPEVLELVDNILVATRRATDLVNQILTFSRQNKQEREPINLRHVVLETVKLLRASVPTTIQIQSAIPDTPAVLANPTAIHQVVMNLGTNAWHAMRGAAGILKIEIQGVEVDQDFADSHPGLHPGSYIRLTVSDTGHGMEAATLERIFDPFFTTKAVGEGTGLGLAVVLGIVQNHDGAIFVSSQPGEGTRFDLYFPVLESPVEPTASPSSVVPQGRGERILFVDDEESLGRVGKKMLERLGYHVTVKTGPLDAIAAVRDHGEKFDLLITDLTMPVMDGARLGNELLKLQPNLPVILTTGYSGLMTEEELKKLGFTALLPKPTTACNLGAAVFKALHPAA